jgi:hypothetical protein
MLVAHRRGAHEARVYACRVALTGDLRRAVEAAVRHAEPDEELTGIIAAEPAAGARVYLCSYSHGEQRSWLVVDDDGRAVGSRSLVRDAVSIAALCELAEESAGGGELDDLASRLVAIRITESPDGIDEAEEAVRDLQHVLGSGPHVATPDRLDRIGAASMRLEQALGDGGGSPFAESMRAAVASVEALTHEVEGNYKRELV